MKLLKFVGAQPSESEKDFEGAFVKRLQNSIREVKASREMGARHMIFQEMLQEERAEGRAEGDRNRLIVQVRKKLEKGLPVEAIAEALEEEVSVVEEIIAELTAE